MNKLYVCLNLSTRIVLLSILLMLLSVPVSFAQESQAADFLFERGKQFYERGNYAQALQEWNKTLLLDFEHQQALDYVRRVGHDFNLGLQSNQANQTGIVQEQDQQLEELQANQTGIVQEQDQQLEELVENLIEQRTEQEQKEASAEYTLGKGDVIEVNVWRHDDLSRTVTIRPDGRIALVLIGELQAAGLSPRELSEVISASLAKFIRQPEVAVIVSDFGSKQILVLGEVNRPGVYSASQQITALEAIAKAGGHKKYAGLRSTMIVRKGHSDFPEMICTDLWSAVSEGILENNVILQSGDIVFVPQTFISKINDFMSFFRSNIKPLADSYLYYEDLSE